MKRMFVIIGVCVMAVFSLGCERKPKADESAIHLTVISPTTGKITVEKDISLQGDVDNNIRQALNMPTKEEEAKVAQYLTRDLLLQVHVADCVYIKKHGSSAFIDSEAKMWIGINYNGVFLPVTDYFSNGMVRAVVKDIPVDASSRKLYRIVYFFAKDVTTDKKETEWYQEGRNFEAEIPELCPLPPN
ncbi:hypothetical protein JW977_02985 [Candidatus Falkowbacteria bacterium]|nr:hypothetical protein [Candidatus Falkowbacteria bacterium]